MAKLLMIDGTVRNVSYNQGAKILAILSGTDEPEDEKQAQFVSEVKDVDFGNSQRVTHAPFKRGKIEHDKQMDNILKDPKLKGIEKAKAVVARIRERTAIS